MWALEVSVEGVWICGCGFVFSAAHDAIAEIGRRDKGK